MKLVPTTIAPIPATIEENLKRYDAQMRKEGNLLDESRYPLNKSSTKFVSVGLSPTLNFTPIVKIWGAGCCVFFTAEEWQEFMYLDHTNMKNLESFGDFTITRSEFRKVKLYEISCRSFKLLLSDATFDNLISLGRLITCKLDILNEHKFNEYYYTSLKNSAPYDLMENIYILIDNRQCHNDFVMLEAYHTMFNKLCLDYEYIKLL